MGVEALIDMERKGCEAIIHDHDCDLWVTTMVGWVDVLYSDWGDVRRQRAVDISSFKWNRLPQFSFDLSDIWRECAQQYCPKKLWK